MKKTGIPVLILLPAQLETMRADILLQVTCYRISDLHWIYTLEIIRLSVSAELAGSELSHEKRSGHKMNNNSFIEKSDASETIRLLRDAVEGNDGTWEELQQRHRARLHRMVTMRLDRRMQARVDASDVVQDAFFEAWQKLGDYLKQPKMPFYLWLRSITGHKLMALHRHHLGTEKRAAGREISIYGGAMPETTCAGMAAHLADEQTRASEVALRWEIEAKLQSALDKLDPMDCEVLMLRHFEQLTNGEVAQVLDIGTSAASKRYVRALQRLKDAVSLENP